MIKVSINETSLSIINATSDLLQRFSSSAITLDDVSKASGVSKSLVCYYFDNKDGLMEYCLARMRFTASRQDYSKVIQREKLCEASVIHNILKAVEGKLHGE